MNEPKPAQEWTFQKIGRFFNLRISDNWTIQVEDDITATLYGEIVNAHNAALAAAVVEERKRCAECGEIQSLTEELAAEREKLEMTSRLLLNEIQQLRSHLAAEREEYNRNSAIRTDEIRRVREQVAALVEALKKIAAADGPTTSTKSEVVRTTRLEKLLNESTT